MNILLVDDDHLVCRSLKIILEAEPDMTIVGTGHDGSQAIALYRQHAPDLLLMDIRMAPMNGLEAAEHIMTEYPQARILFLTTFSDDEYIVKALRLGAKGFLLKQDFDGIVPAIQAVMGGQRVFGGEVVNRIPDLIGGPPSGETTPVSDVAASNRESLLQSGLTERECDILEQVAMGHSNREISEALYLSEGTVRNYISALLEKLHLRDRTQLAIFYYRPEKRAFT